MTDRYSDPDADLFAEPELIDEPTTRLSPAARQHLAEARAKLAGSADGKRP